MVFSFCFSDDISAISWKGNIFSGFGTMYLCWKTRAKCFHVWRKKYGPYWNLLLKLICTLFHKQKLLVNFLGRYLHCTTLEFTRVFFDQSLYNLKKNSWSLGKPNDFTFLRHHIAMQKSIVARIWADVKLHTQHSCRTIDKKKEISKY